LLIKDSSDIDNIRTHELKTVEPFFSDVFNGNKTAEIRMNDRDYRRGDLLILKQYFKHRGHATGYFTGRYVGAKVTHVLKNDNYLQPGYVMLSFEVLSKRDV